MTLNQKFLRNKLGAKILNYHRMYLKILRQWQRTKKHTRA